MAREPGSMQLRLLSTLAAATEEKSSTVVFPVPIELLHFVERAGGGAATGAAPAEPPRP
jgi:hypothetical protein